MDGQPTGAAVLEVDRLRRTAIRGATGAAILAGIFPSSGDPSELSAAVGIRVPFSNLHPHSPTRRDRRLALCIPHRSGGNILPLLVRPENGAQLVPVAVTTTLMMAGLCVNISAKLFLNRSFGVVAANRGIKRGGPYRLVRHPMYFGYILTQVGFVLASFKLTTLALYLVAWTFQILRIREEEKLPDSGRRLPVLCGSSKL